MDSNRQQGSSAPSSSRYANGGGAYNGRAGAPGTQRSQSAAGTRFTGMVVLGGAKARAPAQPSGKLAVPKPVNLPSLRKEHGGNDPTTQLVNPGGTTGWNKLLDEQSLAGSGGKNALGGRGQVSAPWQGVGQPGGPPLSDTMSGPNSRAFPPLDAQTARMDSSEYPTLGAGTKQTGEFASSKQGRAGQDVRSMSDGRLWQDDERRPSRLIGNSWRDRDEMEDERYVPSKLTDDPGRRQWDDDLALPGMPGYGARGNDYGRPPQWDALAGGDALLDDMDEIDDILPGTLAPRRSSGPPPPPPPKQAASETDWDPEREAFEEELKRVAADLERAKIEQPAARISAPPPPEVEERKPQPKIITPSTYGAAASREPHTYPDPFSEPDHPPVHVEPENITASIPTPPVEQPVQDPVKQAEERLARQESLRRKIAEREQQREAEEREAKERAAAKLRALEERLAKKQAEKQVDPPKPVQSEDKSLADTFPAETAGGDSPPAVNSESSEAIANGPTEPPPAQCDDVSSGSTKIQQQWPEEPQWDSRKESTKESVNVASSIADPQHPATVSSRASVPTPAPMHMDVWNLGNPTAATAGFPQLPVATKMLSSMAWASQGFFGPGLFGPQADANVSVGMVGDTKSDAAKQSLRPSGDSAEAKGAPVDNAIAASGNFRDATVVGIQKHAAKAAIIAPSATAGGKSTSSTNLTNISEVDGTSVADKSGNLNYNWGTDLAGEVIESLQRRRDKSAEVPVSVAPARPESRQSIPENNSTVGNGGISNSTHRQDVITDVFGDGVNALPSDLALEPGPVLLESRHPFDGLHPHMPVSHAAPGSYLHGMPLHMGQMAPPHSHFPAASFNNLPPARSGSPWQHPPPPPPPPQHQQNLLPASGHPHPQQVTGQVMQDGMSPQQQMNGPTLQAGNQGLGSFYTGYGNGPFSLSGANALTSGLPTHLLAGHPSPFTGFGQLPQSGPFGGGQYGQINGPAFLPSGKQPDWSSNPGFPTQHMHPQHPPPPHHSSAPNIFPMSGLELLQPQQQPTPMGNPADMFARDSMRLGRPNSINTVHPHQLSQQHHPQYQVMHGYHAMQHKMPDAAAALPDDVFEDTAATPLGPSATDAGHNSSNPYSRNSNPRSGRSTRTNTGTGRGSGRQGGRGHPESAGKEASRGRSNRNRNPRGRSNSDRSIMRSDDMS